MQHIFVRCDCGERLRLKAEHAGRSGKCQKCGVRIRIPRVDVLQKNAGREVSLGELPTLGDEGAVETTPKPSAAAPREKAESSAGLWQPGQVVDGRYEVLELLGQGAYGSVWKVHHKEWNLDLAVKELRTDKGMSKKRRDNFVREAQTWVDDIGMHPHVVTAWYVRELNDTPYLFLEYCDGGSLRDWIDDGKTRDLKTALDIAIQLAWGLAHCHDKGVVHRDFKPDNVMMTADGMAKITDFGLVRFSILESSDEQDLGNFGNAHKTISTGGLLGTPAYMPPEQWVRGGYVDHRIDLYAFGVTIYELLTGQHPIAVSPQSEFPSKQGRLEAYAEAHAVEQPRSLLDDSSDIPTELDQLVQACLAKRRYKRPLDVSAVVKSLVAIYVKQFGEPYFRPEPRINEMLADGLNNQGVGLSDLGKHERADLKFEQALKIDPRHVEATYNHGLLLWREGRITDDELVRNLEGIRTNGTNDWHVDYYLACVHLERGDLKTAISILVAALEKSENNPVIQSSLTRAQEGVEKASCCVRSLEGHGFRVYSVAISSDGQWGLSGSSDKTARLWELSTGRYERDFEGHTAAVNSVAFSSDGRWVLSGSGEVLEKDNSLRLWEASTGRCLRTFEGHLDKEGVSLGPFPAVPTSGAIRSAAISSDDRWALSGGGDETLRLWELSTGRCLRTFEGHSSCVCSVDISSNCRWGLSGSSDGTLRMWELSTGHCERIFDGHTASVESVTFSSDGRWALSGSNDRTLRLWDLSTGRCLRSFVGHTCEVKSVAISPDGRCAISGSIDRTLRLWEVSTGRCIRTFDGHHSSVNSVAMSADGRWALSGSDDKTIRLWELHGIRWPSTLANSLPSDVDSLSKRTQRVQEAIETVKSMLERECYHDAVKLISETHCIPGYERHPELRNLNQRAGAYCRRHSLNAGWHVRTLEGHNDSIKSVAITPDNRWAFSCGDNVLRSWNLPSGSCMHTFEGHASEVNSVAISPDGCWGLSGSNDRTLRMWELSTGRCVRTFVGHDHYVQSVVFSPDVRWVLSASDDQTLRLWESSTARCVRVLESPTPAPPNSPNQDNYALRFGDPNLRRITQELQQPFQIKLKSAAMSSDGRWVLSAGSDNTIRLWGLLSGRCMRTFDGHSAAVNSLAMSPDGHWVLSGSSDKTLRLWEMSSGRCVRSLTGHTSCVNSVAISRDGGFALSGSSDGTVRLWEVSSGHCVRSFAWQKRSVLSVACSSDARWVLSGGDDNAIHLWELDWEYDAVEPADWNDAAQPYLNNFLSSHTPPRAELPVGLEPTDADIWMALSKKGSPSWTEKNFQQLLDTLGCAGLGWLTPKGVKRKLEEMAANWTGRPPLE